MSLKLLSAFTLFNCFLQFSAKAFNTESTSGYQGVKPRVEFFLVSGSASTDTVDFAFGLFGTSVENLNMLAFSSIYNNVNQNARYTQIAGIGNFTADSLTGLQLSGIVNSAGVLSRGIQVGGIVNTVKGGADGVQIAGIVNTSGKDSRAVQIAGLANISGDTMYGAQIAGLYNSSKGLFTGSQVSGFLNVAEKVEGNQIGFINVSDSIYGIPVGFLSYSRHGYHKFEISVNELFPANIAFYTGVPAFHNIFSAGCRPVNGKKLLWYAGYGAGTSLPAGKKFNLLLNVSGNHLSEGDLMTKLNLINKAFVGVEYTLAKKFTIVTGPELNAWMTKTNYGVYPELFSYTQPKVFFDESSRTEKLNTKMWIGWKFGMRFF